MDTPIFSLLELRRKSYISHEWIISKARMPQLRSLDDRQIGSQLFNVPSQNNLKLSYRFGLDPSHLGPNRGKAVLQFQLHNLAVGVQYDADIEISIKSAKLSSHFCASFGHSRHRSYDVVFCKWAELFDPEMNFFNENNELIIKCEGIITGKNRNYHGKDDLLSLKDCREIYQTPAEKSIRIDVHGRQIFVDAEVYHDIFHPSYSDCLHLNISDFSYDTIERAVKYHYHPHLLYPLKFEELMEVGRFFDVYGSQESIDDFAEFLLDHIDEFTVCHITKCAIQAKNKTLEKECFKFLFKCIRTKTPVAQFDELPKDFALKLPDVSVPFQSYTK